MHPEARLKAIKDAFPFWPFIFQSTELKNSPRLKVDWDRWKDEETENQELAGQEGFDPNDPESMDKLVDLMKKNGEWDEDDEKQDIEAMKLMEEENELMEKITKQAKEKGIPVPDFDDENFDFDNPFAQVRPPDAEPKEDLPPFNPNDSFPFESYLKSGDYLHIGKKRTASEMLQSPAEL